MPDETKASVAAPAHTTLDALAPVTAGQLTVPAQKRQQPPIVLARSKWTWWIWACLVAVAVAAMALWYFQPWVSKGLAVTVETVAPVQLTRVLAVNGRLAPRHLVEVKPMMGGEVIAVMVEEGAVVNRGDILARIDASGQQTVVRQAMAGLDAGLLAQSQAEASLARAVALGENISRAALDDTRSAELSAAQEVSRLTAVFDQSQIDLAKFTITAPVAGTLLARGIEVGQVVDATTTLFSVADLGQLVVETDVDEGYAMWIALGLPAILQLKGDPAKLDGSISFVAAQVDAATGGLAIEIAFDDPVSAPVGLTVTANIIVDRKDAAVSVPRAAVVKDSTGSVAYLAVAGIAARRAVTVIEWPADRLEVTSGLTAGDVVITDATGVSDGLAISVPGP